MQAGAGGMDCPENVYQQYHLHALHPPACPAVLPKALPPISGSALQVAGLLPVSLLVTGLSHSLLGVHMMNPCQMILASLVAATAQGTGSDKSSDHGPPGLMRHRPWGQLPET